MAKTTENQFQTKQTKSQIFPNSRYDKYQSIIRECENHNYPKVSLDEYYITDKKNPGGLASIANARTGTYTDTNKPDDFTTDVLN